MTNKAQPPAVITPPSNGGDYLETEEDLDLFLDKIAREYKDGWTEENWEEEMEQHPFFMTKMPDDPNAELPPAVEALRQLKWDALDGPLERAVELKNQGNIYFKAKNYKYAVDSYTQALAEKFDVKEEKGLCSTLHSNRAAGHFHIKNYRSALNDSVFAVKFNSRNLKAMLKCVECCFALKMFDDCKRWADRGLTEQQKQEKENKNEKNPNHDELFTKFRAFISKSAVAKKTHEHEKRKEASKQRKRSDLHTQMFALIRARKICVAEKESKFMDDVLEHPSNPAQKAIELVVTPEPHLKWPSVFLYPEYGQTDFIESFDEFATFDAQLDAILEQAPDWDKKKEYTKENVEIYYENRQRQKMVKMKSSMTLLEGLQQEGYIVQMGMPSFMIMVKNSPFEKLYLQKFAEIS